MQNVGTTNEKREKKVTALLKFFLFYHSSNEDSIYLTLFSLFGHVSN